MQQKLALALALGLSSVLAQDVVSAETPLNRQRKIRRTNFRVQHEMRMFSKIMILAQISEI